VRRYAKIVNLSTHDETRVCMPQVCEYFGVGRRTVLKWVANNLLPAIKIDDVGEYRFKVADLVALERALTERAQHRAST
jgi:excisionase family DNA binding protein